MTFEGEKTPLVVVESGIGQALRPSLTQSLLTMLQQGRSLNLIGPAGQGRERLLMDLCQAAPTQEVCIVSLNIRQYARNYNALLAAFWQQIHPQGQAPSKKPKTMAQLVTALAAEKRPVWILLHQMDALHVNAGADPLYNLAFFDHLNSLRNKCGIGVLVTTESLAVMRILLTHDGQHTLSPLSMSHQSLPVLSRDEIQAELYNANCPR